jgi:hypothetical protein
MLLVGPAVGSILVLLCAGYVMARTSPKAYRWLLCWASHFRMWQTNVAFVPKLKLVVGFFQSIAFMPDVYGVTLPDWYFDWVPFLNVFESTARRRLKPVP